MFKYLNASRLGALLIWGGGLLPMAGAAQPSGDSVQREGASVPAETLSSDRVERRGFGGGGGGGDGRSQVRIGEHRARRVRPDGPEEVPPELSRLIAFEPTPQEVLKKVESHLRLRSGDLKSIRSRARTRAALPLFAVGGRYSSVREARDSEQAPSPVLIDESTSTRDATGNIGILWDLRAAAFHASELDLYSVADLRRRILTEVSRIYLARRLLQIDLYLEEPRLRRRMQIEARIADYTASIDSVTGGWFSEATSGWGKVYKRSGGKRRKGRPAGAEPASQPANEEDD